MQYAEYIKNLKERYETNGISALSDAEYTDLLVYFASPRKDLREECKRLTSDGSDVSAIFRMSRSTLVKDYGFSETAALFPKIILATVSRALSEADAGTELATEKDIGRLFVYKYLGRDVETVYLLLLDEDRRLIDVVLINEGSVNDTAIATRKLLEHSIQRRAKYVAIAHNHPHGNATPSRTDIVTNRIIEQTFSYTDIEFLGHFVVSGREYSIINGDVVR